MNAIDKGRVTRASIVRLAVVIGVGLFGMYSHAFAAQLLSASDCNFVVHVPGMLGGKQLQYHMQKGAVFTENAQHKFCGRVAEATPFGDSDGDQCFAVADSKLVSGAWSNKVTSSNCILSDASAISVPFDVSDVASWSGNGPSNLRGQAFLKTVGGDVKTCAGEFVVLLPATPYVDEVIAKGKAAVSADVDSRLMTYSRKTICDAQGNFSFAGLPAQRWYVLTLVTWGVPHIDAPSARPGPLTSLLLGIPASPATDQQGGDLVQVVTLTPGDNQVFLTSRDEH
jgi:hypothetical protein